MYLNCKTYFSLRYGTYSTRELVDAGAEAGATALALTNINNTTDAWDFVDYCRQANIKPILGVEVRNDGAFCYILLAKNNEGYYEINSFLSHHLINRITFPPRAPDFKHVWIIYKIRTVDPHSLKENELIGVRPKDLTKLYGLDWSKLRNKFVIRQPVTYQGDVSRYNLHRLLRAVDRNIILSKQDFDDTAGMDEYFMPITSLISAFQQFPHIVSNTFIVMESCEIQITFNEDKNKAYFSARKNDDVRLLEKLALEGLIYRYGHDNKEAKERLLKELRIIDQLNFSAYFLITLDFIRHAQIKGVYWVGRGSGANSIVAYCLRITDVDPIDLDLYFERFLNPERTSPPDFDIDFSWVDRDDIMDYVFKRYGQDHVALLGMISTFQEKSPIREFAKVFGLPDSEIEKLGRGEWSPSDKYHVQVYQYSKLVQDFPNQLSIHPCGMLISEKPIHYYTATDQLKKPMPVSHIDMFGAEKIGLYKFDILSQRGLGHIRETIQLVKQTKGVDIDIHNIQSFKKDTKINANLATGNTIGCFYIESPSMRSVLRKLKCDNYLTLVAASSIIRPGVGSSGMMGQFIFRYHNPDKFEYLHPLMKELLQETFGVMIYQEDVIKIAHLWAGMDLAEADILRRGMSGKYRGSEEMKRVEASFFSKCREKNYDEATIAEVWRQMSSFAGYSFSKAHSASFAVESYQSLFLKTYYPVEFLVAVLNNFGGFYTTEFYFLHLKQTGVQIERPCINNSEVLISIKSGVVYIGFQFIKELKDDIKERIIRERKKSGSFRDVQDFIDRTGISETQLEILIYVGAFRFTGKSKKQLLWEACYLASKTKYRVATRQSMFDDTTPKYQLPDLNDDPAEDMMWDIEYLRFPVGNIFDLVNENVCAYPKAKDIPSLLGKEATFLVYLICTKDVYTKKDQSLMHFGTWIDAEGAGINSVHFPAAARAYKFQGRGFYKITGSVMEEFGEYSVSVSCMQKIGIKKID